MPKLAKIYHFDSYWKRDEKYAQLDSWSIENISWKELTLDKPYYFFVPKDFWAAKKYEEGFKIDELFWIWNSGIKTDRDSLFIDDNKEVLQERIKKLLSGNYDNTFKEFYNVNDSGSYKITEKIKKKEFNNQFIQEIEYRPFDKKYIYYDKSLISRPADKVMKHLINNNFSISFKRQCKFDFSYVFIHNNLCESCLFESAYANNSEFPLYLYSDTETLDWQTRTPNLDMTIIWEIEKKLGIRFLPSHEWQENGFTPEDILDYIYAVLHSPTYRTTYKEFLKIDFPRVPYPKDKENFLALVKLWMELRELHLLESPKVQNCITTYTVVGTNEVTRVVFVEDSETSSEWQKGKVYINETQYFWDVPLVAWEFYIGGYQPAQKWLKDRKGRTLTWEDIEHYQQVIVALSETKRIMGEIDEVFII